jgi:hypothetical protein
MKNGYMWVTDNHYSSFWLCLLRPFFRRFGLACLMIFAGNMAVSQQITWGEDQRNRSGSSFLMALGENKEGLYIMSHSSRKGSIQKFAIERYSHQLFYDKSRFFRLKNRQLAKVYMLSDNVFFATTPMSTRSGNFNINGHLLSEGLDHPEKKVELLNADGFAFKDAYSRVRFSPDKQRVGAFLFLIHKGQTILRYGFFDSMLNPLFQYDLNIQGELKEDKMTDVFIDNAGNFFVTYHRPPTSKQGMEHSEAVVTMFHAENRNYETHVLLSSEWKAQSLTFVFDDLWKTTVLTGLYGKNGDSESVGIFQAAMDETSGELRFLTRTPFTTDVVASLSGEKARRQGEGLGDMDMKKTVRTRDGRSVIVVEKQYTRDETDQFFQNGIPVMEKKRTYHFDDVLLLCMDSIGDFHWHKVIHKRQSTEADYGYFSSVLIGVTATFVSIMYNEMKGSTRQVVEHRVGLEGDMTTHILMASAGSPTLIIPVEGRQVGYNRVLTPIVRRGAFSLVKIKLTD